MEGMPQGNAEQIGLAGSKVELRDSAEALDWEQFHTPKNPTMALAGECGELLEVFVSALTWEESYAIPKDQAEVPSARVRMASQSIALRDVRFRMAYGNSMNPRRG